MSLQENKALARRAIDEVWSKGNVAVAADVYGPKFVSHQHIDRIEEGKIVEEWVSWDLFGMMQQLGATT
jgi:hypothetical protein